LLAYYYLLRNTRNREFSVATMVCCCCTASLFRAYLPCLLLSGQLLQKWICYGSLLSTFKFFCGNGLCWDLRTCRMMLGHLLRLKLLLLFLWLKLLLLLLLIQLMMAICWTFRLIWTCMAIFFIWLDNHSFKSWRNMIVIIIKRFLSWNSNCVTRTSLLRSWLLLIEIVWLLKRMLLVLSWL